MTLRRRAALVNLVASGALLLLAAAPMPVPPGLGWDEIDHWYLDVGPAMAAMSSLRLAALVAAGWLALVSGLQLLAAGGARPRLRAVADGLAPRFLRSVACGAAALSFGAALGGTAAAGGPPPSTAVIVPLDVETTTSWPTPTTAPTTTSTTASSTTTTTPPATTTPARGGAIPPASPPAGALAHDEVVVEPGGSFWSIAEQEAAGRTLVPYWRALIELNRDRLVDPTNPDLLYPGQVLRLP